MDVARRRITEKIVLRGMIAGFTLVLLLLGLAGLVAVRGAKSIEGNTARVVREQLLADRLLSEIQAQEDALAAVLRDISRRRDSVDRPALLRRLAATDSAVERLIASARPTPETVLWRELGRGIKSFTARIRGTLEDGGTVTDSELDELFSTHEEVGRLVRNLLASSGDRVSAAQSSIVQESRELVRESSMLMGACLALSLACAALTIVFSRQSIRQMEWHAAELNKVSWHMLQSQEAAARRFSHELHDELGQSLAAVKANLIASRPSEFAARRLDCIELVDQAIANVRELSQLLRPVILDDFGLDAGLRWLTEKFAQRTGLAVTYESNLGRRLADETETHLFRIAQEALTNIARHSGASSVTVSAREAGGEVRLVIEDNGRGINGNEPAESGIGMTGMRARASQAGGEMRLVHPEAGGLRIIVTVPAAPERQNAEQENANSLG